MKRIDTTFLLVCGTILLVVGGMALYQEYIASRADIEHLLKEQAALALEFDLAIRRYVADHIRPEVEKRVEEGVFIPEAMSSSFIARRIFEDVRERFPDYIIKFSSDNPRNPANAASPDEMRVLEYFRDHPGEEEYVGRVTLDGNPYLAHFRARRMEEACLRCHGVPEDAPASLLAEYGPEAGFGRQVGQVIAMDTVAMPADRVEAAVVDHVSGDLAVGALTIVLLFAGIVVAFRYIVTRRLDRITDRARAIADGGACALPEPVEVSGRDEIATLAQAFNRMTDRLVAQRREIADHSETLEQHVAERTEALEQANENLRQEVQARRRIEVHLRDSEERLGQIVSFLPDPTFVVDRAGTVIAWNRAMEDLTGHAADEMVGKGDHAYGEAVYGTPRPMLIDAALGDADAEALYETLERDGDTVTAEVELPLDEEDAVIWCTARPLRDSRGEVVGAVETARDVTDQRRAQEALRRSENEKRVILDATPEFVVLHDADHRIAWTNAAAAEAAGVAREDLVGRHCWEFWGDGDGPCPGCPVAKALETGKMHEHEQTTPDGREWFVRGTPLLGPDGQITGAVEMARDVTDRKRRTQALRESEAKYRLLAENQRDVVVALTPDGTLTYCSPAVEAFGGYHPDEEIGRRITRYIVGDEDKQRAMAVVAQTVRDREPATVEFLYQHREGEPFPVEATGQPVVEDGEVVSVQAVLRDITERKRAEERFRTLFEGSRDALMTLAPPSWRFTSGNPAALTMFGMADEEAFTSVAPWDISPATQPDGRPSEEKGRELLETVVREGSHFFEWTHLGADGEPFPATVLLTRMDVGGETVVQATVRDITARKKAEEALRERIKELKGLNGLTQLAAETEAGVDAYLSQAVRLLPPAWKHSDVACAEICLDGRCFRTDADADRPWRQRAEIRVRGEARGYVEVGYTEQRPEADEGPFLQEERTLINTMAWQLGVIIARMETDQALAEKARELQRSNAELQEFAYVASHDLQEPLRMVSSYVSLLARRYEDELDDDAREFIGYAVDGANRMQALINDLLQYSRVGTKGKPFAPTDGEEVMEDVLANLEIAVKEAGAEVTHDPLPTVVADEGQLIRVFQNLIGNALKFCDGPPEIHVSAEQGEGEWHFSVRDNGIGIDPDQQDDVFTVFHRLHGRDQYAGTGMGLAITKRIVERHGGRIWVESRPGEGSTFHFTLPERKDSTDEHERDAGDDTVRAVACAAGGDSAG